MGSRGASERVRPPGDDINTGDGRGRDRSLACALCGGTKKVDDSRPRRCGPCRSDEEIVRDVTARLAAAKQPPPGGKAPGHDYAKVRRQGDQARARLAERGKARPRPAPAAAPPPPLAGGTRRITAGQKRVGAVRLQKNMLQMEKELAAMQSADKRRDRLREDLAAARRLLAHWSDVVH